MTYSQMLGIAFIVEYKKKGVVLVTPATYPELFGENKIDESNIDLRYMK